MRDNDTRSNNGRGAVRLENDRICVFERNGVYQARIHTEANRYLWRSLKTRNQVQAISAARKLFHSIEFRQQSGLPLTNRSVNRVIDEYVTLRERQQTQGRTSLHMLRQIKRVVKFWREYIGDQSIESVGNKELSGYIEWRKSYYAQFRTLPKNAKLNPTDKTLQWETTLGKSIIRWDAVTTFVRLEVLDNAKINVERFFEFAWAHRNESYSGAWGDLIYGAVVNVLVDLFARNGFFENGVGWKPLNAYQALAKKLDPGDLVVNLNYETLFEMGAMQAGCKLAYVPNVAQPGEFLVAKPHGSINLIVEKDKFWFSEPDIIGSQMARGEYMDLFRGIVPPRYGKSFDQHPVAVRIFEAIRDYRPESVTFWGVGFTSSDADLTKAYEGWCSSASKISLVHLSPTTEVADAERMLKRGIQHFSQPEDWDY